MSFLTRHASYSLYFFAVGFVGFGGAFLINPFLLSTLTSVALPSSDALMEVRSVYGGLFLGIGVFLLYCAFRRMWLRVGLAVQAAILGSLVVGRLLGLILDGTATMFFYALLISEVVGFFISCAALWHLRTCPVL